MYYAAELLGALPRTNSQLGRRHGALRRAQSRRAAVATHSDPRPRDGQGLVSAVWDFFWLFMDTSSIHGFSHLTARNRTPAEYGLWLIVMVLGLTGAIAIGLSTWARYQDNPTVISMERDSHEWNTSFPAATICPDDKFQEEKLQQTMKQFNDSSPEMETFLKTLLGATYESFKEFRNVTNYFSDVIKPADYLKLMLENRFDFTYTVVNSADGPMPEVWTPLTEMGLCYTYNSEIAVYLDPDVWENKKTVKFPLIILSGNELDGDLFSQIMDMNSPSKVYIHGPGEIPDSVTRFVPLRDLTYAGLDQSALALYTTDEARSLSVHQRRCRFQDESNLKLSSVYSYNLCRMECRMRQAHSLCKCIPFFYRNTGQYKICNPEGMLCLANYEESLIRLLDPVTGEKIDCKCLPACDTINFITEMQSNMPWFLGTNLKWSVSRYPQMRLKRDVLFGFTDVLVSIGGTAGLFLGCSILSFIEIIYFFTLHLFWYIQRRFKKFSMQRSQVF